MIGLGARDPSRAAGAATARWWQTMGGRY